MNKKLKQKTKQGLILISILVLAFIIDSGVRFNNKSVDLFVYYLDVGQGDSALIEAPNGKRILIDAGRDGRVISELEKVIPFWDKKIDTIIMTHADIDHIGGFFEVLDRYFVNQVIKSNMESDSEIEKELLNKINKLEIEIKNISMGDIIIIDQANKIYIETYWPKIDLDTENRNENSLVLELLHDENEFLFTGDAGFETELELMRIFQEKINTDVLKVGHHGSKNSTSQLFLDLVTPEYSILSYGENSYGHPHLEILEKLEASGGLIFHTKERATIVARSNSKKLEISYLDELFNKSSFFQSLIDSVFIYGFNSSG